MVSYKELGLVNTREMFAKAVDGGYAIPAFNFNNMEQLQAIIMAASETKSPVILQVSKGARNYANATLLRYMAEGAVAYAKELGWKNPQICLHLDHGDSFETCKSCVDTGFSSVMIDASSLPYEENIALTKKVVEYAHQFDVTVEAELGVLAGVEDEVSAAESHYTKPEEVIDFATRTGCDSLAISIGTSHGAYKFKPEQCTRDPKTGLLIPPPLAFDVLKAIEKKLPGFPIVLHGSSLPFAENIKLTKKVVAYAHKYDVTVEAELGVLAGVEDEVAAEESHYTKPEEVIEFATKTGCDSLAISIGTSHGAYKFKPEQCKRDPKTGKLVPPPLAFDVLKDRKSVV